MDFHSWDQPDPRWLIGLLWMASQVHPVQFPAFSTDTAETFFSNFYNISPEDFQNRILPLTEGIGE
jgi:iron complex transport system substrate-binding protein